MLVSVEAEERPLSSWRPFLGLRSPLLWAAVVLLGAGIGVSFAAVHRSAAVRTPQEQAVGGPVARWAAGKRVAPAFRLADQDGRPVSLAAYRGRPVIVTFIDPLCRSFCPLEAAQLNTLVQKLPAQSRPEIVAVSVNVYGNARANLLQDDAVWRLVPEWRWAVGSGARLATVWRKYLIGVRVTTKKIAGVTVHNIVHTEAAYVIDARGDERALFLWPFSAQDVRATLEQLAQPAS